MENFITLVRPYVEFVYFVSQIGILFVALLGLRQINLAKKQLKTAVNQVGVGMEQVSVGLEQVKLLKYDIETRNKRIAIEKSLEFIERFSVEAFEKYKEFLNRLNDADLPTKYQGEIVDFNDKLTGESYQTAYRRMSLDAYLFLNEIELFSTAMINKIADEDVAFIPLSREFCRIVEENYDIICLFRESNIEYANLVKLYVLWSGRRKKKYLDEQISNLEKVKSSILDDKIVPIGVDEKK